MEKNKLELQNYEEWEYYNHQTIFLSGWDKIIGDFFLIFEITIFFLLLNILVGVINDIYKIVKKKKDSG